MLHLQPVVIKLGEAKGKLMQSGQHNGLRTKRTSVRMHTKCLGFFQGDLRIIVTPTRHNNTTYIVTNS